MSTPDYVYIRAWYRFQGHTRMLPDALAMARTDHAPDDAVYKHALTNQWMRLEDIESLGARIRLEKLAEQIRKGH